MQDPIDIQLQEQGIPFGKYSLIAKLAVGGMAELFVARQKGLAGFTKTVAVKCILPYFARDREFISMFLGEARLAAHLNHPNVVQIQDVGDVDGVYYMVMEYIPGQNLKSVAKRLYSEEQYREEPPYALIASMFVQALQGLSHVHEATDENQQHLHLVHRDISPNNLMLSYDGHVKIVDFGVAKAKTQESETQVGVLKGRLSYMSPEHLSGQPLDGRSDLFAMGVVLYELTTNRRLFKRRSEAETMQALMTSPIPAPSRIYPGYPPGLEEILMKSLNRDPNKRYQTAEEMRDAIEDWLMEFDQSAMGTRQLVSIMDELFPEEKQNERSGIYPKPVTHNDLMNLARGSYRVMEDGSIYTYFAAPGSQQDISPPQGGSAQMIPLVSGQSGATPSPSSQPKRNTGATSPYAYSPSDIATAQHRAVSGEQDGYDDERTTPGTLADLHDAQEEQEVVGVDETVDDESEAPGEERKPLSTASYSMSEEAKASLERGEMPHRPFAGKGPGTTKALPVHPGLVAEADLHVEDDVVTDVALAAASEDTFNEDDEPPTALQPLPPASGDYIAHSERDLLAPQGPEDHVIEQPAASLSEVGLEDDGYVIAQHESGGRRGLIWIALLLLAIAGGAGWWFLSEFNGGVTPDAAGSMAMGDAGATPAAPVPDAATAEAPGLDTSSRAPVVPERAAPPERAQPPVRFAMRRAVVVRRAVKRVVRRRVIRRRVVRRYRPRRLPKVAKLPFSSIKLDRKTRLPVYERRGSRRVYTSAHPRLCRKIEREVGRLFGNKNAVRGITRPWQRYVRKRFAKSRRYSFVFYPRAAAYVIFRDLRRGKGFQYIAQNLVKYQKSYRFSRYRNK